MSCFDVFIIANTIESFGRLHWGRESYKLTFFVSAVLQNRCYLLIISYLYFCLSHSRECNLTWCWQRFRYFYSSGSSCCFHKIKVVVNQKGHTILIILTVTLLETELFYNAQMMYWSGLSRRSCKRICEAMKRYMVQNYLSLIAVVL